MVGAAGVAAMAAPPPPTQNRIAMPLGLIRQAMAYRVKYRVIAANGAHKRKLPLSLLGVHNRNRGGVYPSPETVENLGLKLLSVGFSSEEANHEGVRARAAAA